MGILSPLAVLPLLLAEVLTPWFQKFGKGYESSLRRPLLVGSLSLLALFFAGSTPGYLFALALLVPLWALCTIDIAERRLPTPIIRLLFLLLLFEELCLTAGTKDYRHLLFSLLAGVAVFVLFFLMSFLSGGSLGMGDVRLSAVLTLPVYYLQGLHGLLYLFIGTFGAFVLYGLVHLGLEGRSLKSKLPFGPFLMGAALIYVLVAHA